MGNAVSSVVNTVTGVASKLLGVKQPAEVPEMAPPKAEEAPSAATPSVQAAAESQAKRERAASGRAATQLSTDEEKTADKNLGTKKLLGQ